jgi:large subunit ribosomal protein L25
MESSKLETKTRQESGKKNKKIRKKNLIPAVVYGHRVKSQSLSVDYNSFDKIYQKAGESSLIDLIVDGKPPIKALIKDVQFNPINQKYIHVDFHQVRMTEKLTTEILLKFIGEAPAVKELNGVLVKNLDKLRVECLPKDLVHEIEVDISSLKTFEKAIHVKDIKIPEGIQILEKIDEVVVTVIPPRTEEELKALDEKVEEKLPEEVKEGEEAEGIQEVKGQTKGIKEEEKSAQSAQGGSGGKENKKEEK